MFPSRICNPLTENTPHISLVALNQDKHLACAFSGSLLLGLQRFNTATTPSARKCERRLFHLTLYLLFFIKFDLCCYIIVARTQTSDYKDKKNFKVFYLPGWWLSNVSRSAGIVRIQYPELELHFYYVTSNESFDWCTFSKYSSIQDCLVPLVHLQCSCLMPVFCWMLVCNLR